jgi:hypothetical protein
MTAANTVLRQQQLAFQAVVLGLDADGLLRRAPGGAPAPIGVYRHAHSARLIGALRDNFEILARALGDAGFDALAQAYIDAQPSTQASIRWFGHRLSDFMDACVAPDAAAGGGAGAGEGLVPHPALADLARMDWALRAAFDAADAPLLSRDALAGLPPARWPGLILVLHPSVAQVRLHWAVEAAWQTLRTADDGTEPELPAPQALSHNLLVWRRGADTQWRSLDALEASLLRAVGAGQPFAALCALAATLADGEDGEDRDALAAPLVVGALQQWLADGLLSGLRAG